MSEDTARMDPETTDDPAPRAWWLAAALAVVSAATVFRLAMNFSHSYPPGVDAAYYPLQTRAWLLRGHLMYDDLPLYFWINAAFSKVLTIFGMSLNDAVLFSSRALDSFIEPWVAAGVLALGYVWSEGRRKALLGCTAAAVLAVLSPPVVRMLSDFEKNSLGFVLLCAALWACRSAMIRHTARAWLVPGSHPGSFRHDASRRLRDDLDDCRHCGALMVLLVNEVVSENGQLQARIFAAGAALLVALLALFDPGRTARLLRAPAHLFRIRDLFVLPLPILVVAVVFIGIAMGLLWRDRRILPDADIAIASALAFATALAFCPKSFEYFDRLFLMGIVPACLLLAFMMTRVRSVSRLAGFALFILAFLAATASPQAVQRPIMDNAVAAEMRDIRKQIADPDSTLVVAPHGLEWWAGYFVETPVRNALVPASSRHYRRILYLRNTIDCPPDIASPFGMPTISKDATKVYFGHYVEVL